MVQKYIDDLKKSAKIVVNEDAPQRGRKAGGDPGKDRGRRENAGSGGRRRNATGKDGAGDRKMKPLFLILCLAFLTLAPFVSRAEVTDRIIAVVNDEIVTLREVERFVVVEKKSRLLLDERVHEELAAQGKTRCVY